ncbi:MAG: hypothetical protein HY000_12825 [Planctomycetes bacterium]|nr:hypothetical protein [Planctomycetota bacterium]
MPYSSQSSSIPSRIPWAAVSFTATYLIMATAGAVWTGNAEFVIYIGVMLLLIGAIGIVHRRVGLTRGLLWALSLWGLAHMAGGLVPVPKSWPIKGNVPVLYSWWLIPNVLKFDHLVHAYGFGVTTFLCWEGLRAIIAGESERNVIRPTVGMLVLCVAAALGFGALNEVVEFAATLLVPETNVGGYINTGWDLVSNAVGAGLAASLIGGHNLRGARRSD